MIYMPDEHGKKPNTHQCQFIRLFQSSYFVAPT